MPLSPSSVIWYQPMGGDALWLGRYPQVWTGVTEISEWFSSYGLKAWKGR